jgi:hypothetical protein
MSRLRREGEGFAWHTLTCSGSWVQKGPSVGYVPALPMWHFCQCSPTGNLDVRHVCRPSRSLQYGALCELHVRYYTEILSDKRSKGSNLCTHMYTMLISWPPWRLRTTTGRKMWHHTDTVPIGIAAHKFYTRRFCSLVAASRVY